MTDKHTLGGLATPTPGLRSSITPVRSWKLAVVICAITFVALAPTLAWFPFTKGNENIVVQTALEMRNGGPWLVPVTMGDARVKKPPLVAWVTSLAMDQSTIDRLGSLDTRDGAYADLAWQVRWTVLAAGCLFVLATFEFTRLIFGEQAGLFAGLAAATNYMFFKYMRQSTSDPHLAMWVVVANACFVHGILRNRLWLAATGGAVATAFAFLCKGPVALVETVVPTMLSIVVTRHRAHRFPAVQTRSRAAAIGVGTAIFLIIAMPWFLFVYRTVPGVWNTWFHEVTRDGATELEPSSPAIYLLLGPLTAPWLIFGMAGLGVIYRLRRDRSVWLPIVFALAPLLIMFWFKDRKERYLLPMIGPACAICGVGVSEWAAQWKRRTSWDTLILVTHLILLAALGLALFLGGRWRPDSQDLPHFPLSGTVWGIGVVTGVLVAAFVLQRRWTWAVPVSTFILMLGLNAAYRRVTGTAAYDRNPFDRMARSILVQAPHAAVYDWLAEGHRVDERLPLYLDQTVLRRDPATLTPLDRPTVVVLRQSRSEPPPELAAPWKLLMSVDDGTARWHAFVQYPVGQSGLDAVPPKDKAFSNEVSAKVR